MRFAARFGTCDADREAENAVKSDGAVVPEGSQDGEKAAARAQLHDQAWSQLCAPNSNKQHKVRKVRSTNAKEHIEPYLAANPESPKNVLMPWRRQPVHDRHLLEKVGLGVALVAALDSHFDWLAARPMVLC
jgi:hypothetical protein